MNYCKNNFLTNNDTKIRDISNKCYFTNNCNSFPRKYIFQNNYLIFSLKIFIKWKEEKIETIESTKLNLMLDNIDNFYYALL